MITSPFRFSRYTPFGLGESLVEWATGLSKLDNLYKQRPEKLSSFEFMNHTLEALNISYEVESGSVQNIPNEGPVVIVANHPLGAIEGVILADLVGSVRKDVKVLANQILKRLPELDDLFIGIDVFNGKDSQRTNTKAVRDAHRHLADGGLLIVFPAGEVSAYHRGEKKLTDIEWSQSVAKFVKRNQATTVPIYISGKNSDLFYQAGRIHPLLRTALLGRELLNKQQTSIAISIGASIPFSEVKSFEKDVDIVNYLRLNTYLMSKSDEEVLGTSNSLSFDTAIISPINPDELAEEISVLPKEQLLLEQGDFSVYCSPSQSIPKLMQEIGRVREESFREVGEGSGLACDVDEYDLYYNQLFVWHNQKKELVGAYRMGLVDELIKEHGLAGLYSRSLFNYDEQFIEKLDNSIELGRSVVSKNYQRSLNALLLLWKGIATFVSRNPKYTHLFGPVSISNDYSHTARQLMAATLSIHHYDQDKATLVSPSSPLNSNSNVFWQTHLLSSLASVPLLSKVLARMEQGKGLPVLLRQYLGMNGKLVCFNVDPVFNNALDGLIVVDLKNVPLNTLSKYMGREEAKAYFENTKS
ncbi:lysophospholipid acyltransferase family protein [Vibrio makurazakiensis]|uniref:lysophospholipid acyltransferase family protein n=1 Tax=Vibrio makurazakiensis TaxID=2910250 RepID=UPI003D098909